MSCKERLTRRVKTRTVWQAETLKLEQEILREILTKIVSFIKHLPTFFVLIHKSENKIANFKICERNFEC